MVIWCSDNLWSVGKCKCTGLHHLWCLLHQWLNFISNVEPAEYGSANGSDCYYQERGRHMTSDGSRAPIAPVSIPTVSVPDHPVWPQLSNEEERHLKEKIKDLLIQVNGVLVAHYYTDGRLQDLADETGGCVADSLEMARFGTEHPASTLVVAGVKFMGETSKILTTRKEC